MLRKLNRILKIRHEVYYLLIFKIFFNLLLSLIDKYETFLFYLVDLEEWLYWLTQKGFRFLKNGYNHLMGNVNYIGTKVPSFWEHP